ncbi:hypothetical protein SAMN02745132_01467 [Enterovibrio nigricans DSM 22720]|uniref:Ribbon-helix-helix domain-containing protein n=1 Tax=Enterovibrio nigricans DSM 22720 TaxID=1121868 RepID=A0A1T4UDR6_9GAMM|nr:hypothetical protein SAMN02745132_01467 [Enterovibrio nigricans DSM 22720]
MCTIFAGQDTTNYAFHTRSIRLGGHCTSVRLEKKFGKFSTILRALKI